MKTIIYKNPNGDNRTANKNISFKQFQKANDMHMQDVSNLMNNLAYEVAKRGQTHDSTKKTSERKFYRDFLATINRGEDFVSSEWYQLHINEERHHLLSRCPEDVNLIDILEMIVDCVCAGMTRSGEVRDLEINDDILRRALENTVNLVKEMIVVDENN